MKHQTLRRLVIFISVLMISIFILNILVDNPYTHRLLRAIINAQVKENTNLELKFEAVNVSVMPLGFELYGIQVNPQSQEKGKSLAKASRIHVRVSLWSLIIGRPKLGLVAASDLEVIWPPPWDFKGFIKNQSSQPKEDDQPMTWPPQFELPVEEIRLENSRFYAEFPLNEEVPLAPSWFYLIASGVDLNIKLDGWNDINLDLLVQRLDVARDEAYLIEEARVEFGAEMIADRFVIPYLKINGERIDLNGTLFAQINTSRINKEILSLDISSDIKSTMDLSILGSWLDLGETRGKTTESAQIKVSIPFKGEEEVSMSIKGKGSIEDGYLAGFRLFDSETEIDIDLERIKFNNLLIKIGDQAFGSAQGELSFADDLAYQFDIKPNGLHLYDLLNALGVDFSLIDFQLHSDKVTLAGTGQPFEMTVKSNAELHQISLPILADKKNDFDPPSCRMNIELAINSDGMAFNDTEGLCYVSKPFYREKGHSKSLNHVIEIGDHISDLAIDGGFAFSNKGADLKIASESLDLGLANYFATIPLAGYASLKTRVFGRYDQIKVSNLLESDETKIIGFPLDRFKGYAIYDDGLLHWKNLSARMPSGAFFTSKKGHLKIKGLEIDSDLSVSKIAYNTIEDFVDSLKTKHQFAMEINQINGKIKGPILYPGMMTGTLNAVVSKIDFNDERYLDRVDLTLKSDREGFKIENSNLQLKDLFVKLNVDHIRANPTQIPPKGRSTSFLETIGLSEDDHYKISLNTFNPIQKKGLASANTNTENQDDLGHLPIAGHYLQKAKLQGKIDLQANIEGTINQLQGSFNGQVGHLSILGSQIAPLQIQGFINDSFLDVTCDHSGQALRGRVSMDLSEKNLPYEWYFSFKQFDIRPLGTQVFASDPRNFAYLSADWNMKGYLSDWWNSRGQLNLKELLVKYSHQKELANEALYLRNSKPVSIDFSPKGWQFVDKEKLNIVGEFIDLELSLDGNRPPDKLAVKLQGEIDLALLKQLFDQVETTTGKVLMTMSLTGSIDKPDFYVKLEDLPQDLNRKDWQPLSLGIANIRPAFKEMDFEMVYEKGLFAINSLSTKKGQGTITASGRLKVSQQSTAKSNITIVLDNTNFITPIPLIKSVDSVISGTINISGDSIPYLINGDINIVKSRSTRNFDLTNEILKEIRKTSVKTDKAGEQPNLLFNINISGNESINIRNRNINITLSSDLVLKGSDVKPEVSGQVEIVKGKFVYKRDFEFRRGLITFDDPVKLDPSLDLLAVADVSPYRVSILGSGRASKPVFDISVDPPTKEDGTPITPIDTLILLSRGKLPNRSFSFEERNAVSTEALNIVAGQFEQPVEKLFDLTGQDVIQEVYLDYYPSEVDDSPTPRLNFPINVVEDLDLILRSDPSTLRLTAEYPLHQSISAHIDYVKPNDETSAKDRSNTTFDVKFRFAFP